MSRTAKRVPLDFDWPQGEVWPGYLNPYSKVAKKCRDCGGNGMAPEARRFSDQWYGTAPFDPAAYGAVPLQVDDPGVIAFATRNVDRSPDYYRGPSETREASIGREAQRLWSYWKGEWSHHLVQADVDALIAAGRLMDLTHTFETGEGWKPIEPAPAVTAEQVNAWSLRGMGHDSINQWVCIKARCEREGVEHTCARCDGHGMTYPTKAQQLLAEQLWKAIEPPQGDGFQLWETVTEGSPQSPVFATAEELARWLADTEADAGGGRTASYEAWLAVCQGAFAPSSVWTPETGLITGVEMHEPAKGGAR